MEFKINKVLTIEIIIIALLLVIAKAICFCNKNYSLGAFNLICRNNPIGIVSVLSIAELLLFVLAVAIIFVVCKNKLLAKVINVVVALLCFGLILYCVVTAWNGGRIVSQWRIDEQRKNIENEKTIVIGGGTITLSDGTTYNDVACRESVESCIESGNNLIELDFYKTSDEKLVCTRLNNDYPEYVLGMPILAETITEAEFLNGRIYGEYTPISLDGVVQLMRENPDLVIVTDFQTDVCDAAEIIALTCPDCLDRFYIQIYKTEEYQGVRTMGFRNIILCLDRMDSKDKDYQILSEFTINNDLLGVSYWESWMYFDPALHSVMRRLNVPIYVHAVDENDSVEADYNSGVSAFFTNNIRLKESIENE